MKMQGWKVVKVRKIMKGGNYLVTKSLTLCGARMQQFTLQEQRFMEVYLGLVDPYKPESKSQSFSLEDFRAIMELEEMPPRAIEETLRGLVSKPISYVDPEGNVVAFPLFCEASLCKDERGKWAIEIIAYEKAMPLIFKMQEDWNYIKYSMWNTLGLKSANQIKMYCWLKRHEWRASRGGHAVKVDQLRDELGLANGAYREYKIFKRDLIDESIKAINGKTDIQASYEVTARGARGKVLELLFRVSKNPAHVVQHVHEDCNGLNRNVSPPERPAPPAPEWLPAYRAATENRLPESQLASLRALIQAARPELRAAGTEAEAAHLAYWYDYALGKEKAGAIEKTFFAYLKKVAAQPVHGSAADMENKQKIADANAARPRKNAFVNFNQREYDWAALDKKERAYLDKMHGFTYEDGKLLINGVAAAAAADPG